MVGKRGCFVAGGCLGWLHPWFHATALDGSSVSPAVPRCGLRVTVCPPPAHLACVSRESPAQAMTTRGGHSRCAWPWWLHPTQRVFGETDNTPTAKGSPNRNTGTAVEMQT